MKMSSLRAVGLAFSSVLAFAAAGCGVDLSQVFTSSDGGGVSTGAQGGGGSGPQGGGGSGGAQGGASTTTTAQGGDTTTTTTTDTTTTTTDTTTTTTTTTTTSTGTVSGILGCGDNLECQGSSEVCCWDKWGIGTGDFESGQCKDTPLNPGDCNTAVQDGGVETLISCQTKDDCGGDSLCCGDVVQFQAGGGQTLSYYPKIECRASCPWPTRTLCSGPGDPICQGGTTCKASQLLPPGYFICSMN